MHEPKGQSIPMTGPRRFINDLVYFARQVPSVPVSRTINVSELADARRRHPGKPAWATLFMKGFALVAAKNPGLRRAYLAWPWGRLYEHPQSICALAVERKFDDEDGVFVGLLRAPEAQMIGQLQKSVEVYKNQPLIEVGYYRQALRVSRLPWPIRKFLWWSTLNVSGLKRAKRFGTFGLTSYGALGAESLHPISPLTTTLTFGPISEIGDVCVKMIYDHRVLDGAYVARRLADLDAVLKGPILEELSRAEIYVEGPEKVLKPHLLGYPIPRRQSAEQDV